MTSNRTEKFELKSLFFILSIADVDNMVEMGGTVRLSRPLIIKKMYVLNSAIGIALGIKAILNSIILKLGLQYIVKYILLMLL